MVVSMLVLAVLALIVLSPVLVLFADEFRRERGSAPAQDHPDPGDEQQQPPVERVARRDF
jgi:hypothetical protein